MSFLFYLKSDKTRQKKFFFKSSSRTAVREWRIREILKSADYTTRWATVDLLPAKSVRHGVKKGHLTQITEVSPDTDPVFLPQC